MGCTVNRDKYKDSVDFMESFDEPAAKLKGKIAVFNVHNEGIPATQKLFDMVRAALLKLTFKMPSNLIKAGEIEATRMIYPKPEAFCS